MAYDKMNGADMTKGERKARSLSQYFQNYRPHFHFSVESPRYTLKTAENIRELQSIFKLRYDNFLSHTAFGQSSDLELEGVDIDRFDPQCDHIAIIDKEKGGAICGTYRILCSRFHQRFYSEEEFDISRFLAIEGVKVELGRACVAQENRHGGVIDLLWKGIAKYIELSGAQYLFGCSSINTVDANTTKCITKFFQDGGHLSDEFGVVTVPPYVFDRGQGLPASTSSTPLTPLEAKGLIPPLLRSYLNAGAKVHGPPALDKNFECIDYFTIIDLNQLSPSHQRRYFKR